MVRATMKVVEHVMDHGWITRGGWPNGLVSWPGGPGHGWNKQPFQMILSSHFFRVIYVSFLCLLNQGLWTIHQWPSLIFGPFVGRWWPSLFELGETRGHSSRLAINVAGTIESTRLTYQMMFSHRFYKIRFKLQMMLMM